MYTLLKKYGLLAEIRRPKKWVNMGQQVHRYENLPNRDFHADRPNSKWATDISYIHTGQVALYLSMIRDLYDNSITAYKTAASQTISLVLDAIRLVVKQEKWHRLRCATPLKSLYFLHGPSFLCCPHKLGRFNAQWFCFFTVSHKGSISGCPFAFCL